MLKFLSSVVLVLSLAACSLPVKESPESYAQLRQATWQLTTEEGTCSAVKLKEKDLVLTAAHCDGPDMKVGGLKAVVLKKNDAADLMLVYVRGLPGEGIAVASKRPNVDSKVVLVGFPLGVGKFLTEGRVQELGTEVKKDLPHHFAVSAPGVFGNSGGPVFSLENGMFKIVGIASLVGITPVGGFVPNVVTHLNFPVSTEVIQEFLK